MMAQQVSVAKPDDMSLIPGTHMMEGENGPQRLSSDLHMYHGMCVPTHTYIQQIISKSNFKKEKSLLRLSIKIMVHFDLVIPYYLT